MGLFSCLSAGHTGRVSPTAAGTPSRHPGPAWSAVGPQSTPHWLCQRDAASAASPGPPVPSCCCFPLRATAAGWEGHRAGQDRAPVIALQSLGILPHQINAGAITTDLFYTQRALLGTSPSTAGRSRERGELDTPESLSHPTKVMSAPAPQCKT